jgi:hypothetical protein
MHIMTKSEKADDAPLSGNKSIMKFQGNIEGEKNKARTRRDSYLYNYKMIIPERECRSRENRFGSGIV